MWPSGISGLMSGAAILAFLSEASSDLSSSLPSYPPSQRSWSPTESGFINTRTILNSTRRSAQMEALSHCVPALTIWFLDNGLQLNSTKSEAMILASRQGLSRLEPVTSLDIGDCHVEVRNEIKILGVHLDPTLFVNECPSEGVDKDIQLPYSCSLTCSPRSDF